MAASGGVLGRKLFALRYMTQFKCIAERCEDTCCSGMRILMTAQNEARLREAMGRSPEDKQILAGKIIPVGDPAHGFVSSIAFRNDRICSLLKDDQLCVVIGKHGEGAVPDVCALFPRALSHWPDRVEVSATMACPEAARLCLLHEGSTDLVPAEASISSRIPEVELGGAPEPYVAHVDEVRACGRAVLASARYPVATRLMQLAELGARLSDFFYRGTTAFDGSAGPRATERLSAELARSLEPSHQQRVHDELCAASAPGEIFMQAVTGLVSALQPTANARFNRLTPLAVGTYQRAAIRAEPALGRPEGRPLWTVLWETYRSKRDRARSVLGGRLEALLGRYWLNDWHREWYTRAPSLESHAFRMVVRLGTLQFLLLGHPVVDQLAEYLAEGGKVAAPEDWALFDQAAVETAQLFAKHVEQSTDLMATLDERLGPELFGTDRLGRARSMARAC